VPEYQILKGEIERLVAQINGKYTQPGWVPIHHIFRTVERHELLAWYRLADVALVTPLKDGMNLVSKEYCACQIEGNGVLVLSEFAGASEQLGESAVLVNPYDIDCVAAAIQLAVIMTPEERRPAMERLRAIIQKQNVYWWSGQFLRACGIEMANPRRRESVTQPA
jgi:trehalose 6-phosphate synthase